jgi:hypothetical protein
MSVREPGALIGLAALGGTWAVALAHRRAQLPERTAMLDARTQVQVRLDALRARTAELARREIPAEARSLVDEVVEQQVLINAVLSRAATADDVTDLADEIDDAFQSIEEAASLVGIDMPAEAPYEGLCGLDPAHGVAIERVVHGGETKDVCAGCARLGASAALPQRRQVTLAGRPVPFDEVGAES